LIRTKNINMNNHNLEESYPIRPYDMSKNIISRILKDCLRCYNFRIYGVFGIDEAEDRFINQILKDIKTRINKIHQNRYWDFFYIKDLVNVVKYYIDNPTIHLDNEMDLVYQKNLSLKM
jgi:nucleoside-diphosphate-sugar epimerase